MTEQRLNGRHPAASIDQLGGEGVAQHVGRHLDPGPVAGRFQPVPHQVIAQRPSTIQKKMVAAARPAYSQVRLQSGDSRFRQVNGAVLHPLAPPDD